MAEEMRNLVSNASSRRAHIAPIRRALLSWYRHHARPLPWRETRDPYAVWVSEVMLQQTQVATVIPYYQRFLTAFPTLRGLAKAPLERVLELWSGLGYYRRARNLHRAAQLVARGSGERFPRDYAQAIELPGVGDYTARAVLSIAYNLPYFVLDGNVARVVARLEALEGNLNQSSFRSAVESALDGLLSRRQPGNFNQAMMELGQTVCWPRAPRCTACPVRKWCRAYRLQKAESYPEPRPRRATESRHLAVAIMRRGRKVALMRGLDDGLMPDVWNFPGAFGGSRLAAFKRLQDKLSCWVSPATEIAARPRAQLRHGITYRSILVDLYPAEGSGRFARSSLRWFALSRLHRLATSKLALKIGASIAREPVTHRPLTR